MGKCLSEHKTLKNIVVQSAAENTMHEKKLNTNTKNPTCTNALGAVSFFESDRKKKYCSDDCRIRAYRKSLARRKKPKLTLAEVNALARAEGLNYGLYVAKYDL